MASAKPTFHSSGTGVFPSRSSPQKRRKNSPLLSSVVPSELIPLQTISRAFSINEVQTCSGDADVDSNWQFVGMFSGGKATVGSLTIGSTLWLRGRTVGIKGIMGVWNDPAKITVV